jgi:hypothetical protein
MAIPTLLKRIAAERDALDIAQRSMREIEKFDQDRAWNLSQIKTHISRLRHACQEGDRSASIMLDLASWVAEFESEIAVFERRSHTEFPLDLERELRTTGYTLSEHLPDLSAGLFRLEVSFESWSVRLWYGPKQELLDRCPLSAPRVAKRLRELESGLGSGLDTSRFLDALRVVCSGMHANRPGEPFAIIDVLKGLSGTLGATACAGTDREPEPTTYRRADLSYDLFRRRGSIPGLSLVIATRALTRHRSDFLWVPSDERGRGANYSHLRLSEVSR